VPVGVVDPLEVVQSSSAADRGETVRDAWATMRLMVSWTARVFGSPVRASVAARTSAMARLRRLARTGAAWVTDSRMRRWAWPPGGSGWLTRIDPMTSPLTSSGSQLTASGRDPQIPQASSGTWSSPPR
jgi:hypothetical protein